MFPTALFDPHRHTVLRALWCVDRQTHAYAIPSEVGIRARGARVRERRLSYPISRTRTFFPNSTVADHAHGHMTYRAHLIHTRPAPNQALVGHTHAHAVATTSPISYAVMATSIRSKTCSIKVTLTATTLRFPKLTKAYAEGAALDAALGTSVDCTRSSQSMIWRVLCKSGLCMLELIHRLRQPFLHNALRIIDFQLSVQICGNERGRIRLRRGRSRVPPRNITPRFHSFGSVLAGDYSES